MKPRFTSTNITPRRNDEHQSDEVFWGRFERAALKLHAIYPDLEFVRTRDTWELRAANQTAMEAFEELALIWAKRVKCPQVRTPGDAVQALIWTMFSNHKIGGAAALKAIERYKKGIDPD